MNMIQVQYMCIYVYKKDIKLIIYMLIKTLKDKKVGIYAYEVIICFFFLALFSVFILFCFYIASVCACVCVCVFVCIHFHVSSGTHVSQCMCEQVPGVVANFSVYLRHDHV